MRNLHVLFDEVCNMLYSLGVCPYELLGDSPEAQSAAAAIRVCAAYQPNYPLAGDLHSLVALDHEDESGNKVVWLPVGYHPNDMNPYAPQDAFERY